MNRGPRRFTTADLEEFIEDVRRNIFLGLVKMPIQWKNQESVKICATHNVKIQGRNIQANGVFTGAVQRPTGLDPYSAQARKVIKDQNPQGKVWQAQNPEHRHPVLIKFMARFLPKYATSYFAKLLVA